MMNSHFIGPVNIGNPVSYHVRLKKIAKLTNLKSEIVYKELPKDDPKRRKPDISLAISKLNWRLEVDLESGLEKTIEYLFSTNK